MEAKMESEKPSQEILDAANKLVDEILKEANDKVKNEGTAEAEEATGIAAIFRRGSKWQNRARGVVTRLLTQLRIWLEEQ